MNMYALINAQGQQVNAHGDLSEFPIRIAVPVPLNTVKLLYPTASEVLPYEVEDPQYDPDTEAYQKLPPVIQRANEVRPEYLPPEEPWSPTDHDRVVVRHKVVPLDLAPLRDKARTEVSLLVDEARAKHLSPGLTKILEYMQNEREAKEILSLPAEEALDPAAYPLLSADVAAAASLGIEVTLRQVAQTVLDAATAWKHMGAATKLIDQAAKSRIAYATTKSQLDDAVSWAKSELGKLPA